MASLWTLVIYRSSVGSLESSMCSFQLTEGSTVKVEGGCTEWCMDPWLAIGNEADQKFDISSLLINSSQWWLHSKILTTRFATTITLYLILCRIVPQRRRAW
jgi:hypothetical protein